MVEMYTVEHRNVHSRTSNTEIYTKAQGIEKYTFLKEASDLNYPAVCARGTMDAMNDRFNERRSVKEREAAGKR